MNDGNAILLPGEIHKSFAAYTYFPTAHPIFLDVVAIPAMPFMPDAVSRLRQEEGQKGRTYVYSGEGRERGRETLPGRHRHIAAETRQK